MGDRAGSAALDQAVAAFDGQRGVTVEHGRVFLLGGCVGRTSILPPKTRPLARPLTAVTNVMIRNRFTLPREGAVRAVGDGQVSDRVSEAVVASAAVWLKMPGCLFTS
ncbi:hypothetical protein GCM10009660_05470 [Catellatospora bangladeshensis]